MKKCKASGCERSGTGGYGWCDAHYQRWWTTGDAKEDKPIGFDNHPTAGFCMCPEPRAELTPPGWWSDCGQCPECLLPRVESVRDEGLQLKILERMGF